MLSTFSLPFEPGFPPSFLFHPQDEPVLLSQEPVASNSSSDDSNPKRLGSGSGYDDDKYKKKTVSGSDRVDERKHRRMLSNRESARRSRMRKQKHLENLRNQANRLKLGNREQTNRLRLMLYQTQLFRRENNFLRTEAVALRQRLWDIRQVLVVRQLQQLLNPMPMQNNHPTI